MRRPLRRLFTVAVILLVSVFLLPTSPGLPKCAVLFGVAANPLTPTQDWESSLRTFESESSRPVDIAHFYKRGQSTLFPTETELSRANQSGKPLTLFYNWRPDGLTWRQVADGAADEYLHRVANHLAQTVHGPFFLSLTAEMEPKVDNTPGSGQTAQDFHDYFRYVVTLLRSNPSVQVVTVMNYTGAAKWATQPWFHELYPGNDVVDWIAQDPYAYNLSDTPDLASLVNRPSGSWPGFYNWAAQEFPSKPQMLAEWGVAIDPANPEPSAAFFTSAAQQLAQFPKLRALVYWNHSGRTADGHEIAVGTTAIDSSQEALRAFRNFVQNGVLRSPEACRIDAS